MRAFIGALASFYGWGTIQVLKLVKDKLKRKEYKNGKIC